MKEANLLEASRMKSILNEELGSIYVMKLHTLIEAAHFPQSVEQFQAQIRGEPLLGHFALCERCSARFTEGPSRHKIQACLSEKLS